MLLGVVLVGLGAGVMVGRSTERARRSYKDYGAAKVAVPKGRQVAFADLRRALMWGAVVVATMLTLFLGVFAGASQG